MTESITNPKWVPCPACNAKSGELCTQPDDFGRHAVKSFHWSRLDRASEEARLREQEAADDLNALPVVEATPETPEPADEPLELPAELDDSAQWRAIDNKLPQPLTVHEPCGQLIIDTQKNRELHRVSCPSIEARMTIEQIREARALPPSLTPEEIEARRYAFAEARGTSRAERSRRDRKLTEERYRREGLRPFPVYSEGYAANEGRSGAVNHGTHWGSDFNDAIARWAREDREASRYLSYNPRTLTWTYWGCALFDNLHDAQRSFG